MSCLSLTSSQMAVDEAERTVIYDETNDKRALEKELARSVFYGNQQRADLIAMESTHASLHLGST